MKYFFLGLVSLLISSCDLLSTSVADEKFIIREYSIALNTPVKETLVHRGRYYCLTNHGKFICLTSNFLIDSIITESINKRSFDFVYEIEDTLIAGQYGGGNHYLGSDYTWRKYSNNPRVSPLYEDSNFTTHQCCAGEFGGGLFFHAKKNNRIYSIPATCAVVINKIDSNYYVTTSIAHGSGFSKVFLIKDPTRLYSMDNPEVDTLKNYCNWAQTLKYNNPEKYGNRELAKKNFERGSITLLDTMGIMTVASFVRNNKLYHIITDFNHTTIARIKNHALTIIDTVNNRGVWAYRPCLKKHGQTLMYSYSNDKLSGFITTSQDTIISVTFN